MTSEPVDFVLITALEEERDALLSKLPSPKRVPPSEDDVRVYFKSRLPTKFPDGSVATYTVIVVPLLSMGRVEAANATSDAIRRWQPRFVLLVGIAGGISDNGPGLGDVLVSDQIVDYELQKITQDRTEIRYKVHQADPRLLGAARNLEKEAWGGLVNEARHNKREPVRYIGPIATGDKVVARKEFLTQLKNDWPKLIGVEMEAGGVSSASFQASRSPGFLMVRGVSDLADKDKDSVPIHKWRRYACDIAASYAVGLLRYGPIPAHSLGRKRRTTIGQTIAWRAVRNPFLQDFPLDSINKEEREGVLFGRIRDLNRGNGNVVLPPNELLTVDRIYDDWSAAHVNTPLTLVLEFPGDVPATAWNLAKRASTTGRGAAANIVHSVRGVKAGAFFDLEDPEFKDVVSDASRQLQEAGPTLFLIVFTEPTFHSLLITRPDFRARLIPIGRTLSTFCTWALSMGHRVAFCLPRFVFSLLQHVDFDGNATFVAPIFSRRDQADPNEGERNTLAQFLPSLLMSANSQSLRTSLSRIFAAHDMPAGDSPDTLSSVAFFLRVARALTDDGFYDIAYRIELYCRTAFSQSSFVTLEADIILRTADAAKDRIVGFLDSVTEVPAIARRGILTGDSGSGKSTTLLQIERLWALPQRSKAVARSVSLIPLRIKVSSTGTNNLTELIRSHLRKASFLEIREQNVAQELPTHTILAGISEIKDIDLILGSPIVLLVDGMDEVPIDQRRVLEDQLEVLATNWPQLGLLVALRTGHDTRLLEGEARITLRALNERQCLQFLRKKSELGSLHHLLGTNSTPIGRLMRNPYLLEMICDLSFEAADVEHWNVKTVIQEYTKHKGRQHYTDTQVTEMTETWLPQIAFALKRHGSLATLLEGPELSQVVARGRRMGLLREGSVADAIEFRHELLLDFFCARELATTITRDGFSEHTAASYLQARDAHQTWGNVLRILASCLKATEADDLIKYIAGFDLKLATHCLLELPRELSKRMESFHFISSELIKKIDPLHEPDPNVRAEYAESMGFLDPRLGRDDPVEGMVVVGGRKSLKEFWLGRYPVTNMEFAPFVQESGYARKELWTDLGWKWVSENKIQYPQFWFNNELNKPNFPVVGVSLYEALAYCRWLSMKEKDWTFTLPSDLQWDCAAHGLDYNPQSLLRRSGVFRERQKQRSYGNEVDKNSDATADGSDGLFPLQVLHHLSTELMPTLDQYEEQIRYGLPTAVGIFRPNSFGCFDLFSSVWEWCDSWLPDDETRPSTARDSNGWPAVVKGGPWKGAYNRAWLAIGGWFDPYTRFHELGFRVCCFLGDR